MFFEGVKKVIHAGKSGGFSDLRYPYIAELQQPFGVVQPDRDEVFVGRQAGVFFEFMA
jgi:hypothetical protein